MIMYTFLIGIIKDGMCIAHERVFAPSIEHAITEADELAVWNYDTTEEPIVNQITYTPLS